jgi:hypothetical protein
MNTDSEIHKHAVDCKIKRTPVQKLTSSANRSIPPEAVKYITSMTESLALPNVSPLIAYQTALALVR